LEDVFCVIGLAWLYNRQTGLMIGPRQKMKDKGFGRYKRGRTGGWAPRKRPPPKFVYSLITEYLKPKASATGWHVTLPSQTLSPFLRAGSSAIAFFQPFSASART
jgi:hypothetical protein